MSKLSTASAITAIIYTEGNKIDTTMRAIALQMRNAGCKITGFIQLNEAQVGRSRCNMVLQELSSGARIGISEDRGPEARGCMLNIAELTRASTLASAALEQKPDLLVINKFGKTEAGGGGFRPLIAEALARGVAILIAVPRTNIAEWQSFAADLSIDHIHEQLSADPETALAQLRLIIAPQLACQPTSVAAGTA